MKRIEFKFNSREISYDEFINDNSIQVLSFEYIIPRPLFPPVKRISRLYFFRQNENPKKIGWRYNLFNILFGWLGFPFGPVYTISAIKKNFKGIDFTNDFRVNITKSDFDRNIVIIEKIEEIFIKPDKSVLKELKKAFDKYIKENNEFESDPIVALKIDDDTPVYYIGLMPGD